MTGDRIDPFAALRAMGFARLVPIIPPGAPISERSNIARRLTKGDDPRGKVPGVKLASGEWCGFDWTAHDPDDRDLARWRDMQAGVGVKTGEHLHGIDADTLRPELAEIIDAAAQKHFGLLPKRVGQKPKALYPIRCDEELPYLKIEFGEPNEKGQRERVEILGRGKQFVAHGVHPKTRDLYSWPRKLVPLEQLPSFPASAFRAFLDDLAARLPKAGKIESEGSGEAPDQALLRGDPAFVRKAVEATPNTSAHFPSRESYRNFGYAIKAALPDDEAAAFNLFADWCARWTGGTNEPEIVAADWKRMKPPFRRGASWLYEIAEQASGGAFRAVERWLEQPPEPEAPLFPDAPAGPAGTEGFTWGGAEPPSTPPALVDDLVPYERVLFIGGQSGSGKTFVAMDLAAAVVGKGLFLNREVNERVGVVVLAGEGAATLNNRWIAACDARGMNPDQPIYWLGAVPNLADPVEIPKLIERLRAVAAEMRARDGVRLGMVIFDTLAATFLLNDENDNSEAARTIRALKTIGEATDALMVPVHHYGKGSESGLRGASAWRAGCDAVLSITCDRDNLTGLTSNHWISLAKNRVGEEGPICSFELRSINLGTDAKGRPFGSCYVIPGANRPRAGGADPREAAALDSLGSGLWMARKQAGASWAGHAVAKAYGLDLAQPGNVAFVTGLLARWLKAGVLVTFERTTPGRNLRQFVGVAGVTPLDLDTI